MGENMALNKKAAAGAFVIGGVLLLIAGIAAMGGDRLVGGKSAPEYVICFEDSIQGLQVGAPVVLRGVPVGTVTDISLLARPRQAPLIPVHIRIRQKSLSLLSNEDADMDDVVRSMVDRGMRASLVMTSFVTGQCHIELDIPKDLGDAPEAAFRMPRGRAQDGEQTVEIPTAMSAAEQILTDLLTTARDMGRKGGTVDTLLLAATEAFRTFTELAGKDGRMAASLDASAEAFRAMKKRMDDMEDLLRMGRTAVADLDVALKAASANAPQTLASLRGSMENLEKISRSMQALTGSGSPAMEDLRRTLRDAASAMRALRAVADTLERNPEALLYGKKGGRR